MADQDVVALSWLALWGAAGVAIAWALVPPLLGLFGFTTLRNGAEENPDDLSGTDGFVATSGPVAKVLASVAGALAWLALQVVAGRLKALGEAGLLGLSQLLTIGAGLSAGMVVLAIAKARRAPATMDDPHREDVYRQLRALGFKPLGIYWEHVWFLAYHWCLTAHERIFYSREQRAFAAVSRYVVSEPVRVSFKTCFRGGAFLSSRNHSESNEERIMSDKYLCWGRVTNDLALLLTLHQAEVEKFKANGWDPETHDNFVTLLAIEEEFGNWALRRDKALPVLFLVLAVFLLGILPLAAGYHYGWAHWSVPVGILAGVGLKLGLENLLNERIIQERRQEIAGSLPSQGNESSRD